MSDARDFSCEQDGGRRRFSLRRVLSNSGSLLLEAFREWRRDNALELGAALAYYTVFSLAPLLVIVIAIAGLAFGREAAQGEIFSQFRGLIGAEGAAVIQTAVESASKPASGIIAGLVGLVALILGAGGVFGQLQTSLDRIWNAPPQPSRGGWKGWVRQNLLSFALVVGVGFLLLVSLVMSAGLAGFGRWIGHRYPGLDLVLGATNEVLSFAAIALLFALVYRVLPNVRLTWRDVWFGGVLTALLFELGKSLIGLWVSTTKVGSTYGVAGTILVVLTWVYYASQIVFYGAECTQVFATRYGTRAGRKSDAPAAKGRRDARREPATRR